MSTATDDIVLLNSSVAMKFYLCVVVLILGVTVTGLVSGDTAGGVPVDCSHSGTPVGGDDEASSAHTVQYLVQLVENCWHDDSKRNSIFYELSDQNDTEIIHQLVARMCNSEERRPIHQCTENVTTLAKCMTNEEQDRVGLYILYKKTVEETLPCRENDTLFANMFIGKARVGPRRPEEMPDVITQCYRAVDTRERTPVEGVNGDVIQKIRVFKDLIECLDKVDNPAWLEGVNAVKAFISAALDSVVCMDPNGGGHTLCKTILQE